MRLQRKSSILRAIFLMRQPARQFLPEPLPLLLNLTAKSLSLRILVAERHRDALTDSETMSMFFLNENEAKCHVTRLLKRHACTGLCGGVIVTHGPKGLSGNGADQIEVAGRWQGHRQPARRLLQGISV